MMSTYDAHIPVYRCYPFVCASLQQLAADELLESKNDAILALDANCRTTVLDCLDCIFDLLR